MVSEITYRQVARVACGHNQIVGTFRAIECRMLGIFIRSTVRQGGAHIISSSPRIQVVSTFDHPPLWQPAHRHETPPPLPLPRHVKIQGIRHESRRPYTLFCVVSQKFKATESADVCLSTNFLAMSRVLLSHHSKIENLSGSTEYRDLHIRETNRQTNAVYLIFRLNLTLHVHIIWCDPTKCVNQYIQYLLPILIPHQPTSTPREASATLHQWTRWMHTST